METEEDIRARYLRNILSLNSVHHRDFTEEELGELDELSASWSVPLLGFRTGEKYLGSRHLHPRVVGERRQELDQSLEGYFNRAIISHSFGVSIPAYLQALNDYKMGLSPEAQRASHRALLVGALTPTTIREFVACVGTVFPKNECTVVDIEGVATKEFSDSAGVDFQLRSAIALEPSLGHFDSIFTNILMRSMETTIEGEPDTAHGLFFRRALEQLNTGGRLILLEIGLPENGAILTRQLLNAGFSNVQGFPALQFKARRSVESFLGGTDPRPREDLTARHKSMLLVSAVK